MRAGRRRDIVEIFRDTESLCAAAADRFVQAAQAAINRDGRFVAGLSGGQTPRRMYELLGQSPRREQIVWAAAHLFFVDERCVPPTDSRSNYRMIEEALLRHISVPKGNVFRIPGELGPLAASDAYEAELRRAFPDGALRFDFLTMGMGTDGHTASLFPGSEELNETQRWVVAGGPGPEGAMRVSLSLPAIHSAKELVFLVSGASKARMVEQVLGNSAGAATLPVQRALSGQGIVHWLLDPAAAEFIAQKG